MTEKEAEKILKAQDAKIVELKKAIARLERVVRNVDNKAARGVENARRNAGEIKSIRDTLHRGQE